MLPELNSENKGFGENNVKKSRLDEFLSYLLQKMNLLIVMITLLELQLSK